MDTVAALSWLFFIYKSSMAMVHVTCYYSTIAKAYCVENQSLKCSSKCSSSYHEVCYENIVDLQSFLSDLLG